MGDEVVLLRRGDDGVAQLILNRPEQRNALTYEMGRAFEAAVKDVGEDRGVRVVVVRGAGPSFCAGATYRLLQGWQGVGPEEAVAQMLSFYGHFLSIRELKVPTIAAVGGGAVGAGAGVALACDLRVVAKGAKLRLNFSRLALCPGMGVTAHLTALVGPAAALEMMALGRDVDSQEMERRGLADRVVSDEGLEEGALALARELATRSPLAVAQIKGAVRRASGGASLREMLELEARSQAACFGSEDYRRAMEGLGRRG